jgi:hypothetical protein
MSSISRGVSGSLFAVSFVAEVRSGEEPGGSEGGDAGCFMGGPFSFQFLANT